jgi:hypothetical protein
MTQQLSGKEEMEYLLSEAQRQLRLGAYRMAQTWAYHARRLAGDDPDLQEQADALLRAARQPA